MSLPDTKYRAPGNGRPLTGKQGNPPGLLASSPPPVVALCPASQSPSSRLRLASHLATTTTGAAFALTPCHTNLMCFRWQSHSSSSRKRSKTTTTTYPPPVCRTSSLSTYTNYPSYCLPPPSTSMTDQEERHTDGMSLHPPSPFIPSLTVSKTKRNGIVQLSSPVANLLASASSSSQTLPHSSLAPSPTLLFLSLRVCMYVFVCADVRAHQTNTDGLAGPLEQEIEDKKNKNKKDEAESFCMGPFMHAGHPSITWGENSPPATVPFVPCAPGSRESVSSHRYHTTPLLSACCVCLPVCLCPSVPSVVDLCPAYPSDLPVHPSLAREKDIFGDTSCSGTPSSSPPPGPFTGLRHT